MHTFTKMVSLSSSIQCSSSHFIPVGFILLSGGEEKWEREPSKTCFNRLGISEQLDNGGRIRELDSILAAISMHAPMSHHDESGVSYIIYIYIYTYKNIHTHTH